MSLIDRAFLANSIFARDFDPSLTTVPTPKLAVVTCMDCRLSRLDQILGLHTLDIQVVRNAGSMATEDVIRSLVVSIRVIGTEEILIIGHTCCGLNGLREEEFVAKLADETGTADGLTIGFMPFTDVEKSIRDQVQTVRSHPWIPKQIPVRGAVFDVDTGELRAV
jgi:carbonic anhydrase